MSKLVDKARLAKLAQALDARAKAAVQAEADRAMAAEEALQGAIDAINHAETGILKQAKDYADAAVQTEKEAREEAEELLDGRLGDLEEVIFGGEGAEDGIDKMKSDIQANAEAIAKLNGGAEEEGSVAKAVADGVKPVQDAVDAAEDRLDAIEAEQLTQNAAIEAAQDAAEAAQADVDAIEKRLDDEGGLVDRLEAVEAAAQQAQDEVDIVEGRMDAAESDIDQLQADVARLDGDVNTEGSVKKQIADAIDRVDGDASALAGRVEVLEGEMDAVEGEVAQIKLDMAAGDKKALEDAQKYADEKIAALVDSAPEALDTLRELAEEINNNKGIYDAWVTEHAQAMAKMKADLQKEIDDDVAAEAALRVKADEDLQEAIDLKANQADFEAHVTAQQAKEAAVDAAVKKAQDAADNAQKEVDAAEERITAAEGEIEATKGRIDAIEGEQLTQNAAIEANKKAAEQAQKEVDAAEERITAAEAAIVANKEACEEAMAQEVIDRNKAISDALEPYSTTEEVKGILTNVVSSLDISMADDKLVLKLGGAEGVALSETTLDMATDADIDAIIAGLDAE